MTKQEAYRTAAKLRGKVARMHGLTCGEQSRLYKAVGSYLYNELRRIGAEEKRHEQV